MTKKETFIYGAKTGSLVFTEKEIIEKDHKEVFKYTGFNYETYKEVIGYLLDDEVADMLEHLIEQAPDMARRLINWMQGKEENATYIFEDCDESKDMEECDCQFCRAARGETVTSTFVADDVVFTMTITATPITHEYESEYDKAKNLPAANKEANNSKRPPFQFDQPTLRDTDSDVLREILREQVEKEEYMNAAMVRDELERRESKKK